MCFERLKRSKNNLTLIHPPSQCQQFEQQAMRLDCDSQSAIFLAKNHAWKFASSCQWGLYLNEPPCFGSFFPSFKKIGKWSEHFKLPTQVRNLSERFMRAWWVGKQSKCLEIPFGLAVLLPQVGHSWIGSRSIQVAASNLLTKSWLNDLLVTCNLSHWFVAPRWILYWGGSSNP